MVFPLPVSDWNSIQFSEQGLAAALNYQKGPYFTFDSLNIIGKTKTKKGST